MTAPAASVPSPGHVADGEALPACGVCGLPLRMMHGWPVDAFGGIDCPAGGLHDITTTEDTTSRREQTHA